MTKEKRIFLELIAPPFLAVMWITVALFFKSDETNGIFEIVGGFFVMLLFGYVIGIIPSLIFTFIMEVWFRSGLSVRYGLVCTAGLSCLLGAGAGLLTCVTGGGLLIGWDFREFVLIGAVVGLSIGLYVGKRPISAA